MDWLYLTQILMIIVLTAIVRRLLSRLRDPKTGKLMRPLGTSEEAMYERLLQNGEPNTARALGLKVKEGFILTKDHVVKALQILKSRHASLQVTIRQINGRLWFVPYEDETKIPYSERMGDDWVEQIEILLNENTTFDKDLLWKVTRLLSNEHNGIVTLIFNIHHSIMDGLAMSHLMVELSDILNALVKGEIYHSTNPAHDRLLFPCEHYLFKNNLIKWLPRALLACLDCLPLILKRFVIIRVMNLLLALVKPDKQAVKDNQLIYELLGKGVGETSPKQRRTTIVPISLSREETERVIRKTKEHKTTCYGLVVAASTLAFAELIEDLSGVSMQTLESKPLNKTRTSVNLRRFFKGEVPETYMGTFMSVCSQNVEINFEQKNKADLLTETAHRFSMDIQHQLKDEQFLSVPFVAFSVFKVINNEANKMLSKLQKAGIGAIFLIFNNYGAVGTKKRHAEDPVVEATSLFNVIAEHNSCVGPLFTINCSTINGYMCVGVLHYTYQTTQKIAEKYAQKLRNKLINFE